MPDVVQMWYEYKQDVIWKAADCSHTDGSELKPLPLLCPPLCLLLKCRIKSSKISLFLKLHLPNTLALQAKYADSELEKMKEEVLLALKETEDEYEELVERKKDERTIEIMQKLSYTYFHCNYPCMDRYIALQQHFMILVKPERFLGWITDNSTIINPTYEFYPPKNIHGQNGTPIYSLFLQNTLNTNHFPLVIMLPDGNLFITANMQAMIFNWKTNKHIQSLPGIPNGVQISSPLSAGATLLPLTPENNYTPEILICGGSMLDDNELLFSQGVLSSQSPASDQCVRMVLNDEGIAVGWQVEHMPEPRIMAELILLPDG
ncbi:hypothetical protein D9758_005209 [Tetrapyrgos nigripes]|uniref:Glyoxal oxidase N-terminal domain-containing protein n=1 Tax=Tetrapyrgos nigripes TaxID=182062 RepID=A0A8H5GWK7_9AGAR|nr:hypothetical protein D9758_005209 [Tetrapyrgos nigripes]